MRRHLAATPTVAWAVLGVGAPVRPQVPHDSDEIAADSANRDRIAFVGTYLEETDSILSLIDRHAIANLIASLVDVKARGGRLFVLGVGGGAAHAAHAVNDVRKIAGIEAYTPTDNVPEITARTNDDGWESVFVNWLKVSRLGAADMILVFSVGGGDLERRVSPNLVRALEYAQQVGTPVGGIVGRSGGYTAQIAEACVIVPTVNPQRVTPHTEGIQALVWHLCVSHPSLRITPTKWESMA